MNPIPLVLRLSSFSSGESQTPFNTAFAETFENSNVEKAAVMLTQTDAAQWVDLGAWVSTPPVARKVQFVHEAIKIMSHGQETAAEGLLRIWEELSENRADHEHVAPALEYMLHASTHARWVHILLAKPDLLGRYCALLGNGSDAAFAFSSLAGHMARSEETSIHTWEIWERAVEALNDVTRPQVSANMNAIDRPVFSWNHHRQYKTLWPELYDKHSVRTRLPVYAFVFPGDTLQKQEENRELALTMFLHNASRVLGRPACLSDFKGIRRVQGAEGQPTLEINYPSSLADQIKYYLGFGQDTAEVPSWPKLNALLSVTGSVSREFERCWLTSINSSGRLPTLGAGRPIYQRHASREQYAAVFDELSEHNLLIGEEHDQFAALNFIVQNMPWLRERGFTTIYLEDMPAEAQRLANAYLSGRSDAIIPPELEMMACEYMAILKNAKKTGMRVIFVGSDAVKAYGVGPLALSIPTRAAALNAFAVDIINDDSKWRANGKFVALFGIHHLYRSSSATWSVPGIQCALPNCKSVYLFDIHPTGSQAEPGETFLVVSHDQKQNMKVGDLPLVSHLMADLYVGARMPLRMSMNDNQISDVAHRGVLALELPPGITYRRK